jgi:hypothetical protein
LKGPYHATACNIGGLLAGYIPAAIEDRAGGRLQELGQQIEKCGLTRAVRADQGVDFALADAHRHAIDRDEPVEVLDQTMRLKDDLLFRHRALPPSNSWSGCAGTVYARSVCRDGKLFSASVSRKKRF